MNDLKRALLQIVYINKAFVRNPASAFFTLVFPLMFLVIFSVIFGNGVNRLVAPTGDDPMRTIDTGNGRVVGGDRGVREQLVRQYQADRGAWEDVVLIETVG